MSTFAKNAIISGYINIYCLVCKSFFKTDDETFSHIKSEEHEASLLAYPCLEKYGIDRIRKVKEGYFCEHCSLLMATAVKVNLHIDENLHYKNKGNALLKKSGSIVTAFDDVLITEDAWHSFADDACVICDAEFDDGNEHKEQRSHLLKLVQNVAQFGVDNSIYRKIDKNYFQCLTCNTVIEQSAFDHHFTENTHKQMYIQCQQEKVKFDLANPKVMPVTRTEIKENNIETKVSDHVALNNIETIAGKPVEVKEETKKADSTPETEIKPEQASKTKKLSETNVDIKTYKEESSDPATYAKDNKLAYDSGNTSAFCKICEKKFASTLRGMKEHVEGRDHINKTTKTAAKAESKLLKQIKLNTQPMELFVKSVAIFDNTEDKDIIINESICVAGKSFFMCTKISCPYADYKCQICLENLFEDDLEDHWRITKHEKAMRQIPIVLGLKLELIREVRPESFHCGYCNLMIAGWSATDEHLKTAGHKTNSASCQRRFRIHLPAINALKDDVNLRTAFYEVVAKNMWV